MSEWLPQLSLREPLWLLIVPLCWILLRLWRSPGYARQRLTAFAEPALLKWLIVEPRARDVSRLILPAMVLIAFAASGIYIAQQPEEQPLRGIDIAVVVDISPSMLAGDIEPNRLQRARLELSDFTGRLATDRIALVTFSAHAYPLLPLTHDLPMLAYYLEALDPTLTRRQGSNLVPALELAAQTLDEGTRRGRAILLLSDGEVPDTEAVLAASERLAGRGIPVFALGLGTIAGAPIPSAGGHLRNADGELVISRLNRPLLEQVAQRSGGRYSDAYPDDRDWDQLFTGLDALERDSLTAATAGSLGYPLHSWLLAAGLLLLIWTGVRRYASVALPALVPLVLAPMLVLLPQEEARASPWPWSIWSERSAHEALSAGRYDEAMTRYQALGGFNGRMGQGAAAYRQGEWQAALDLFTEAERLGNDDLQRAGAVYNRANTLARLNRIEEALAALDKALRLHPNHSRAALNQDLLKQVLAEERLSVQDRQASRRPEAMDELRPGEEQDQQAAGQSRPADPDSEAVPGSGPLRPDAANGIPARATDAAVTPVTPMGEAAISAMILLDAISDDPREVLRHRMLILDVSRPRQEQPQPW